MLPHDLDDVPLPRLADEAPLPQHLSLPVGIEFQIYQVASYLLFIFFSIREKISISISFPCLLILAPKRGEDFGAKLATCAHTSQDKEMDVHDENGHEDQEAIERERQEWARQMRLRFTPPEMLHEDGSIDFEYAPCMLSFIPDCRLVG
jgi:hypothetical protein